MFGRKIHGPSSLAAGPARLDTAEVSPLFLTRMAGPLSAQSGCRSSMTGLRWGRNWASLWKPLIDAVGPVPGEDPARPFHPHDDRIVSLALHHTIDTGIARDVIIGARRTACS